MDFQTLAVILSLGALGLPGTGSESFRTIYNTQEEDIAPLTAEAAVGAWRLPEGFRATLFAGEPDVHQPIGMMFDSRGRLWVAENYTYAEAKVGFAEDLRDRIVILADQDGDGRHDQRTVFWDQGQQLASLAVGFGGVFALCPPQLVFIPDRDGDDVPDGAPEVLLDGFEYERNHHTVANGLKWGPDGWLYGRQGIQATSFVGTPGASEAERTAVNGSIWRYHPTERKFELVVQGTTNPWGADWDEHGELFFINTVIGHLWHAIPGAYFKRMYGPAENPHVYEQIDQVADHVHWDTRETWNQIQKGMSDTTSRAGGGHAHTGLLIYQGDNWPAEYRNRMFTLNYHGKRVNQDIIRREGASYRATHGPDFLTSGDPYFRGLDLIAGPDGGVYVSDWSDIGECHDDTGVHRTSGRVYRITYREPKNGFRGDVASLDHRELVRLLGHTNEWISRQARLVLQERAAAGRDMGQIVPELKRLVQAGDEEVRVRLRALWGLYAVGAADGEVLRSLLRDANEHVRVWAVRLLVDRGAPSPEAVREFARMAEKDSSGLVLCYLASALQRIPPEQRWDIGQALARRGEFEGDRVLPLLTWYGLEAAVSTSAAQAIELIRGSKFAQVRDFATRRVFESYEENDEAANGVVELLREDESVRPMVLRGMAAVLQGVADPEVPEAWRNVAPALIRSRDLAVSRPALELDARFGNAEARAMLRRRIADSRVSLPERRHALKVLLELRDPGMAETLVEVLGDSDLAVEAARGLAAVGDAETPGLLLRRLKDLEGPARVEVIHALVSRPTFASELLEAVHRGEIQRKEIGASDLRQLREYQVPELQQLVGLIWPAEASAEGGEGRFARYRGLLSEAGLKQGDPFRGREIYQVSCGSCHKLYGEGGAVGPELTGSGRHDLEYLLENTLAPSSVVPDAYRVSVVTLKDERVLNGIILGQNDRTLTLQTISEKLTLPRAEVVSVHQSQLSMMPDGLLDGLTEQETRDLFSYLMSTSPPVAGGE